MLVFTTLLMSTPLLLAGAGDEARFEAPVQLTAAGQTFNDMIYPTPVLQDLDGDGVRELVIGDLIGNLWTCTLESPGDDVRWSAKVQFRAEGENLRLNNW